MVRRLQTPAEVGEALATEAHHHPAHPSDPVVDGIDLQERVLHGVHHGWLAAEWDDETKRVIRWRLTPEGVEYARQLARDQAEIARRSQHFEFWTQLLDDPTK